MCGAQIAKARRESPHRGSRHHGLARALVEELPCADAIAAYLTLHRAAEEQAHEPNETRPRGQLMADPLTERLTRRATGRELITIRDETCAPPNATPTYGTSTTSRASQMAARRPTPTVRASAKPATTQKNTPTGGTPPPRRLHVPSPVAGPGSKTASRSTSTSGC